MELGFLFTLGAAVIWGLFYALTEKILVDVSPLVFLFFNSVLISILLLPVLFFDGLGLRDAFSNKYNFGLIVLTAVLSVVASFFIYSGIKSLGAGTASMFEIAYPFFVVLFCYILFRTVPNLYFFIGGILIFIGSFIIIRFA